MRVGDRLAELLLENGVEAVFGVPGGQTLPLYEGIRKLGGKISHILMRDERSAGCAADAHARISGKTGVCDATVGPGATNLLSPLAEAFCSSIPVLAIISDISTTWEHRRHRGNASQALEQLDMFRPVSKWQVKLTDPRALETTIAAAFRAAATGRPGPVVVSIPDNVGFAEFSSEKKGPQAEGARFPAVRSAPDPEAVREAARMVGEAKRPLLVAGGGVHISGCCREVKELAELCAGAVLTSISGKGAVEETHPQVLGVTGSFGNPVSREVARAADLVFFIGCKAGQLTTFGYKIPGREIPVIHLDQDPEEIGANYPRSLGLVGDARLGLGALCRELRGMQKADGWDFSSYRIQLADWYRESTAEPGPDGRLRPQAVMERINRELSETDLVVCDASLSSGWAAAYLRLSPAGRRFAAPRGLAGLGWGPGAAVGAALAASRAGRIIQIVGDGGFAYSVQELEVMKRLELPVLTVVLNNDTLGWIKHVQRDVFDGNYISTDFSHVDYATVARGFGARSYTANTIDEFSRFLETEKNPEGPAVIDVMTDQWESPLLK